MHRGIQRSAYRVRVSLPYTATSAVHCCVQQVVSNLQKHGTHLVLHDFTCRMKESKYFLFMCVLVWTLAIGSVVRAGDRAGEAQEDGVDNVQDPAGAEGVAASRFEVPPFEDSEKRPPDVLRLYDTEDPDVTSVIIHYLKLEGQECTEKRLALSVVGAPSGYTTVETVLKKLNHVFRVRAKYGDESLILSASSSWKSLLKPEPLLTDLPRNLDPIDTKTQIESLCTCTLFLGRDVRHRLQTYTCADVSVDDTPLAGLPVATEAALPAVIMEAEGPYEEALEPTESMGPPISVELLLKRMLQEVDRLYLTESPPAVAAGDTEEPAGERHRQEIERIEEQNERRKLHYEHVFLHTQHQLDLIFPAGMYHPVTVINPAARTIEVGSRSVQAYPACNTSYVCASRRHLRLVESSWEALKPSPLEHRPPPYFRSEKWALRARLLAARAGSETEQHPQVVLLRLFVDEENGEEHWIEQVLRWVEEPNTGEQSPATRQTFRQVLAANTKYSNSLTRLLMESSLRGMLVKKMIQLYNINKEEMFSMWDREPKHSALDPNTMEGVFTRPINTPVFRPIRPEDVLVSPADSVIQQLYQLAPNANGEINDVLIAHIKDTTFYLSEFLYGGSKETPVRLSNAKNRLNVIVHTLSPQDYHRVHSPADWTIRSSFHVPACLPSGTKKRPAPGSTVQTVERTSLIGTWDPEEKGEELFFALVLVGADFTGGIHVAWEDTATQNRHALKGCDRTEITRSSKVVPMCLGEELGGFTFGSTVVLFFETHQDFQMNVNTCDAVLVGQREGLRESGGRRLRQRCFTFPSAYGSSLTYLHSLRNDPETAGKQLIKNTQLPSAWRSNAKTAAAEVARAVEKGLIYANALAQQIMHLYARSREYWSTIVLGQPVALFKFGGTDASIRRLPVICYPDGDKKKIRVKFQGHHSSIALFFATKGDEAILFGQPHFGCDGRTHFGNRAGGLQAYWILGSDGFLKVTVAVQCGLGGQHRCVESGATAFLDGRVVVTARCQLDWSQMRAGTTVTECAVNDVHREVVTATTFEIQTTEFTCSAPEPTSPARPLARKTSTSGTRD